LQPYLDAAESYVTGHLNRAVYADDTSLKTAQDGVAATIGTAYTTYQDALTAAAAMDNPAQQAMAINIAEAQYAAANRDAVRVQNGVVANGAIEAAMLLTLGNLFANRESDVVGVQVASLPSGARELLRPFRLVSMP
jgi:hypothetical protein